MLASLSKEGVIESGIARRTVSGTNKRRDIDEWYFVTNHTNLRVYPISNSPLPLIYETSFKLVRYFPFENIFIITYNLYMKNNANKINGFREIRVILNI